MNALRKTLILAAWTLMALPAAADTTVLGSINVNTTWTVAASPYLVTGDLTIANQARLTIEPGVVVKFAATDTLAANLDTARVELIVAGELVANGTESERIQFIPASGTAASSWYGIRVLSNARNVSVTHSSLVGANIGVTSESPYSLTLQNDIFTNMNTAAKYVDVVQNPVFQDNTVTGHTDAAPTIILTATTTSSFTIANCELAMGKEGLEISSSGANVLNVNILDTTIDGNVNIDSTSSGALTLSMEGGHVNGGIRVTSATSASTASIVGTVVDRSLRYGIATGPNVTAILDRVLVRATKSQGIWVRWGGSITNSQIVFSNLDGLLIEKDASQPLIVSNNTIAYNGQGTPYSGIRVTSGSDSIEVPFLIQNNIVMKSPMVGVNVCATCAPVLHNNDVWGNGTAYSGIAPDAAAMAVNPLFEGGLRDDAIGGGTTNCVRSGMDVYSKNVAAEAGGVWVNRTGPLLDSGREWFVHVSSVDRCGDGAYCKVNSDRVTTTGWYSAGTGNKALLWTITDVHDFSIDKIADGCSIVSTSTFDINYDVSLTSYSPLIDVGTDANAPATDFLGAPRPFDGNFDGNAIVDIGAYEFGPTSIKLMPSASTMNQGDSATFDLVGVDAAGNEFPLYGASWSVVDPDVGWVSSNGVFTAKDQIGTFDNVIVVQYGSLQASASVTINCRCTYQDSCTPLPPCFLAGTCVLDGFCMLDHLVVTPNSATVPIQMTQAFTLAGYDVFDNRVALGPVAWSVVAGGGTIDSQGVFTAQFTAGTYTNTVKATSGGKSAYASVVVSPGPLSSITVTPDTAQVATGATQQFKAVGVDALGNLITNLNVDWTVEQGGGTISPSGLFSAGCTTGTFTNTVVAKSGAIVGHASVTVVAGAATSLQVSPATATLAGFETLAFTAGGLDACGNETPVSASWSVVAGGGAIDRGSGLFTAGCTVGSFANTVKASYGALTATASVTVTTGAATTLVISPGATLVGALLDTTFTAKGYDACDLEVPVSPTWSVTAGGGTIDPNTGAFLAGCTTGLFADTVKASFGAATGKASVTVVAGAPTTAEVNPAGPDIPAGASRTFTASAQDACGNIVTMMPVWSAGGGGTIDKAGVFTAGCTTGEFPDAVIATFGATQAKTNVRVTDAVLAAIDVNPPSPSVAPLATEQFNATGRDSCGGAKSVTVAWSVVAGGGSIDSNGVFTAGTVAGAYLNTVKASSGAVSGLASVTVTHGVIASLTVDPASATLQPGGQKQFTALARDAWSNTWEVLPTWSVQNGGGTIDSSGLFIASNSAGYYADTVTATAGEHTARATVTVQPGSIGRVEITPPSASVQVNGTTDFTATAYDAWNNEVPSSFNWSVTAGGGSVDTSGKFTAGTVAGEYAGTVHAAAGAVVGTASVTITAGPLSRVTVQPGQANVAAGQPVAFNATGADAYENVVAVTPTWSVVNGGGSISSTGIFTAGGVAGNYPATVRAEQGGIAGVADVTVSAGPVGQVNVSPASVTMGPGGAAVFSAACLDSYGNATGMAPTWSVVGSAGTIDETGAFTAGTATGSFQNAVRAICGDKSGYASVTVQPGTLATLAVSPSTAILVIGGQVTFTASGLDAFSNPVEVAPAWSVVGGGGTIDTEGRFTAGNVAGAFTDTIRATVGSVTATASVIVKTGSLAGLVVTPASATVPIGTTRTFTAKGVDSGGNEVALADPVEWSVVADGGTIGLFTGVFQPGCTLGTFTNTVRALSGAFEGTATVTVAAGDVADLDMNPTEAILAVNDQVTFQATASDACGNIVVASPTWSLLAGGGTLTNWGRFTAGRVAGRYEDTVEAAVGDVKAFASVVVQPGALNVLSVTPKTATLNPGTQRTFTATGADAWGNPVEFVATWSVGDNDGTIDEAGVFTAGTNLGTFPGAVVATFGTFSGEAEVRVVEGAITCTTEDECPDGWFCDSGDVCVNPDDEPTVEPTDDTASSGDLPVPGDTGAVDTGNGEGVLPTDPGTGGSDISVDADGTSGSRGSGCGMASRADGRGWVLLVLALAGLWVLGRRKGGQCFRGSSR